MRKMRVLSMLAVPLALVLLVTGTAMPAVDLEPVITGRGEQYRGFANDTYVVYTNWARGTKTSTAFAKPLAGGARIRINPTGTEGNVGGFDPGTNRVLYQQWTRRGSALYFYDLDTEVRTKAPGVNSRFWEWNPLISSTFIVYALDRYRNGAWYTSLKVFRRGASVTRTLGTWKESRTTAMFPGSAGDRYITYTLCRKGRCDAYLYDWDAKTKQQIPSRNRRPQYAPVIDEVNSTVYFTRSGAGCGHNVDIWRRPVPLASGDPVSKIVDLPGGIDTGWESSVTANGATGQMDLYVERWVCATKTGDVYVARGVDLIPAP